MSEYLPDMHPQPFSICWMIAGARHLIGSQGAMTTSTNVRLPFLGHCSTGFWPETWSKLSNVLLLVGRLGALVPAA